MDSFTDGHNDAIDKMFGKGALGGEKKVHLRVHLRSRKKCMTTVEGLADDLDLKKILRALKKQFKCNGAVVKDELVGEIIQLQGDNRTGVLKFLVVEEIINKDSIVMHGF